MLSVIELAQKDLHHMAPFIRESKLVKLSKAERNSVTAKARKERSFLSDRQCFKHARWKGSRICCSTMHA